MLKDAINYEDFAKIDIKTGVVQACENVPQSEKLLKLDVDFGEFGKRTILTGIAKWYSPQDLINKQYLFVFNLKPRKMMGLESQGMILGIGTDPDQKPVLLTPETSIKPGESVM